MLLAYPSISCRQSEDLGLVPRHKMADAFWDSQRQMPCKVIPYDIVSRGTPQHISETPVLRPSYRVVSPRSKSTVADDHFFSGFTASSTTS
jgi:hypothetical protein